MNQSNGLARRLRRSNALLLQRDRELAFVPATQTAELLRHGVLHPAQACFQDRIVIGGARSRKTFQPVKREPCLTN